MERNGARFRSAQLKRRAIGIRRGGFAEIRRALPRSYRESRKAVSTVVFGPAVSLERSTPLLRGSHAENKNISPAACTSAHARSFARSRVSRAGERGPMIRRSTGSRRYVDRQMPSSLSLGRACRRETRNDAAETMRAVKARERRPRRRVELLAYLTKSVT